MKKLISLAIVAIMLLAAIIPAGAAETEKPVVGYSESLIEKISDDKIASLTDIKSFNTDDVKTEYKITDAEGLVKFADLVADAKTTDETTGKVTGHNFKDVTVYLVADIDVSTNADFHPIGNRGKDSNGGRYTPFRGTFDGQGHTIKLSINGSYSYGCALFAGLNTAVVKNIIVEGKVLSSNTFTAGIVGWLQTSTVSNVLNRAMIASTSKRFIGGIVGDVSNNDTDNIVEGAYNTIINATNEGNVTAQGQVGGILGRIYESTVKNNISKCINYGAIRGTYETSAMSDKYGGTAGIVGNVYNGSVDVSECYNFGDITASKQVGAAGIIGILREGGKSVATVKNCFNKGTISCVAVDEAGKAYEELVGAYAKDNKIITEDTIISPLLTVVQEASYTYDADLEPKADEPVTPPTSGGDENNNDNNNNNNNNDNNDNNNTANTDKKDENTTSTDNSATTTEAPAATDSTEKSGCGGAVMGAGMVLMAVCACGCAVVSKKRR